MIERTRLTRSIETALRHNTLVALLGPRQSGKTTLARAIAADDGAVGSHRVGDS